MAKKSAFAAISLAKKGRYEITEYHRRAPFASFLPGIAGHDGTPLWCFYVNRGQCVSSFGYADKDHSILEFRPADQAYRDTARMGFRTFVRNGQGCFREPFGDNSGTAGVRTLSVGLSDLWIAEEYDDLRFEVAYATLPGEAYPALLRKLSVTNNSGQSQALEILDGIPRIVPMGIRNSILKEMSTTAAAWIETDISVPNVPAYRIRASIEDSVVVRPITQCHFSTAVAQIREKDYALQPIVDPAAVFGADLSLTHPEVFQNGGLAEVFSVKPILFGCYPVAFAGHSVQMEPGETMHVFSIYGHADSSMDRVAYQSDWGQSQWYVKKMEEYTARVEKCVAPFRMQTARPELDAYTVQTALDNTLRGGMPQVWSHENKNSIYHIYSRKHGDMERDYNAFALPPLRYSAGFGNYRDMNQNRRIDIAVNPAVGDANIRLFMDLIQPDGYNPLIVKAGKFILNEADQADIFQRFPHWTVPKNGKFTPGDLLDAGIPEDQFSEILGASTYVPEAEFGEGYWVDHWTYNLDLIDQYLRIFPDKETELFFEKAHYRWRFSDVRIRPLNERFFLEGDTIVAQDHLIEGEKKGRFLDVKSTLAEKLITLALVKVASIGYEECGLEMEAGRPGWYDALNGLPGFFGSSLSDGAELLCLLRLLIARLKDCSDRKVTLFIAAWDLLDILMVAFAGADKHWRWLARERARSDYRSAVGVESPCTDKRSVGVLRDFLVKVEQNLARNLTEAAVENGGILPTYYQFEVEGWTHQESVYMLPNHLVRKDLPLFLEGAVKQMKISPSASAQRAILDAVQRSPLYDKNLGMYVLNASLTDQPPTIGRAKAFPDGWLENGSVWLHMEYKYLLEILRSGDDSRFWKIACQTLIPFLSNERYGRSPYENSSFIASSRYPVESQQGRGFVGRLSGATAEYLTLWSEFLLGRKPFIYNGEGVHFRPMPSIPAFLFREDCTLEFVLFGKTVVRYENPKRINLYAGEYQVSSIQVFRSSTKQSFSDFLPKTEAVELRNGIFREMVVVFQPKAM